MSRPNKRKIAEDLDHAFELALILSSVISGTLAQYVSVTQEIDLPPIIANLKRLSIVFVFPFVLTVLLWITMYFTDNETWKMRLRTYAWSSIIFSGILGAIEFSVVCNVTTVSESLEALVFIFPTLLGIIFPIIPLVLIMIVLRRYKVALGDTDFFANGKRSLILRYTPLFFSYATFWLSLYWTMST